MKDDLQNPVVMDASCKFCRKPLKVVVDRIGLELCNQTIKINLLDLAACNRCADLRTEKITITRNLVRACTLWNQKRTRKEEFKMSNREKELFKLTREKFSRLISDYCALITKWTGLSVDDSNSGAVDFLILYPDKVYEALQRLWTERKTT